MLMAQNRFSRRIVARPLANSSRIRSLLLVVFAFLFVACSSGDRATSTNDTVASAISEDVSTTQFEEEVFSTSPDEATTTSSTTVVSVVPTTVGEVPDDDSASYLFALGALPDGSGVFLRSSQDPLSQAGGRSSSDCSPSSSVPIWSHTTDGDTRLGRVPGISIINTSVSASGVVAVSAICNERALVSVGSFTGSQILIEETYEVPLTYGDAAPVTWDGELLHTGLYEVALGTGAVGDSALFDVRLPGSVDLSVRSTPVLPSAPRCGGAPTEGVALNVVSSDGTEKPWMLGGLEDFYSNDGNLFLVGASESDFYFSDSGFFAFLDRGCSEEAVSVFRGRFDLETGELEMLERVEVPSSFAMDSEVPFFFYGPHTALIDSDGTLRLWQATGSKVVTALVPAG